jgi:pimeloyl-ACP methyl ester carboxylesterase
MLQELGTYQGTLKDSTSGQVINITYRGAGNFNASVNTTSQTVARGSAASYLVTVSSVSGFAGTVNLTALNFSSIPGATGSWSSSSVAVPSNGSAQATFTIQTSSTTTPATYSSLTLQGTNGSVTNAAAPVSLTVSGGSDAATLVIETIPDNTQEAAGASYTKTWTIGNSGTTTWGSSYSLQYVSGNAGCNHTTLPLGVTIPPSSSMIWSTSCTAPSTAGTYREDWKLVGPSGTIPVSGSSTVWVQVVVAGGGSVTITSISPSSPVATAQNQTVTVLGSGFQANLTVDLLSNATTVGHLAGSQIQQVTSSSFVMSINFNGNAGAYAIRVNSPNGGPSSAPYSFNVVSPSKPQLTISQTSLSFQSIAGQSAPPSQNVIVSSVGGAIPFGTTLTYGGTAKWLIASPATGTTPATLNLTVTSGLAAGNYTATLTISSTSDSTQTAQVQATLAMAAGNLKLGAITMVDPVPSLLSGPSVTSDPTVLSSGGTPVQGVAADGVAQIVLKIPSSRLGESFTLSLYNDVGGHSISSDLDGGLLAPGGSISSPSSSLTVTSVQVGGQYQAFAVFRAPIDFSRPGTNDATSANRSVKVIVQSIDGPSGSLDIDIERPPVLLVHGIWSNSGTWQFFCPRASDSTSVCASPLNSSFYALPIDYGGTDSFSASAALVFSEEQQALSGYKSQIKNVAAVQWDVVAHSMGGNVTRTIAARPDYQRSSNYNSGDFHKIITIDTPHLGSEFAARLEASNDACKTGFNAFGHPVGGAVSDLVPGPQNPALLNQSSSILMHVIGAFATAQQTSIVENNINSGAIPDLCPSLLPKSGGFASVFSDAQNDLVVSVGSQLANQPAGSTVPDGTCQDTSPTSTICDGNSHTVDATLFIAGPDVLARTVNAKSVIGAASPIPQKVIDLLNSWIVGGQFDVLH